MNRSVLFTISAALCAAVAFADGNEARAKFIEAHAAMFKGNAVASDAIEAKYDFERATGEGTWQIALPVDDDDRVRFLEAVIRNGKFVRGKMYTFGFQEEKITAVRFARLRAESMMVARRGGSVHVVKRGGKELPQELAVYAPTSRPLRYKAPPHPDGIRIDPCGRVLGNSRKLFDRIAVSLSTLAYDVMLEGPEGVKVPLGACTPQKTPSEKEIVQAIRAAVEKKHPDRVGAVSDRDVADFFGGSVIVCRGILK